MSVYTQLNGILSARQTLDDQYWSKALFRFSPLQGKQDGTNKIFQIPQERVVVYSDSNVTLFPQVYKNNSPLVFDTAYSLLDPVLSVLDFAAAPAPEDSLDVSFNWVWLTDIEWDEHLNRAANLIGYTVYWCTGTRTVNGTATLPDNGSAPSDIPDGLFVALMELACSLACRALATRFSTRYDTSAGQQSFSPSQMAKQFTELAANFEKRAYADRDDFYKGQGREYRPATAIHGYILPSWTPQR